MDIFGEAQQILDLQLGAVVQDGGAGHATENLMLVAFHMVAAVAPFGVSLWIWYFYSRTIFSRA